MFVFGFFRFVKLEVQLWFCSHVLPAIRGRNGNESGGGGLH